uniref:5-methyltetrahydropteroyltriglutamate--homocysteine S-methyltransferase n=1 Tax=Physcomitrium patens TaxID=3218 RepID=A0A2K1KWE4_PHYPA|nr:hypothetical protein PHYPA_005112 [Physcomitrium patens]
MARGNKTKPVIEMTKWFDTNYHHIVPELSGETKFIYSSHKAVSEYKEAKELGIDTVPVLVGPVTYLLLSKGDKSAPKGFDTLSLLDAILPVYKEVITELKEAGASWIQLDEPKLVMDLEAAQFEAFKKAYAVLGELPGVKLLVKMYFTDLPSKAYQTLCELPIAGFGVDLVRYNVLVSTSCSLLHCAVDLKNETKLDVELKSWMAFAAQKLLEVVAIAKVVSGEKDEEFFSANAIALESRRNSPRVHNKAVKELAATLAGSELRRATSVSHRLEEQQKYLSLPILPTTTIGSFPQTPELRRVRREVKSRKISEEDYDKAIKAEIDSVVKLQEELDIDVLVHVEPERNDMVEYFGEQLNGFCFSANGWVQSYGSRCVKPSIIFGDVSRSMAMTVYWSTYAQSVTKRPMNGMLTGPVTILNWTFVRNDHPRSETCYQIALPIKDEVEDLEKANVTPEHADYLRWAVHGFRITTCGVKDTIQIHTHMCYSNFNDIIHSIIDMDADVITIENSRSDEKLLSVFREGLRSAHLHDINSPRIPPTEEMADSARKMLAVLESKVLRINPDCGLKTRKYGEVVPALTNMVNAAKPLRAALAKLKSRR